MSFNGNTSCFMHMTQMAFFFEGVFLQYVVAVIIRLDDAPIGFAGKVVVDDQFV